MSSLKTRGWTQLMVEKFLGAPDQLAKNPRYRSAAPMRLYSLARVEEAEMAEGVIAALAKAREKAAVRSAAARTGAATKTKNLLAMVEGLEVSMPVLPCIEIMQRAIDAYNDWAFESNFDFIPATPQSDRLFLERIQVNFIRHRLTVYDRALEMLVGRAGKEAAIRALRKKIYGAIAKNYPYLEAECLRQAAHRGIDSGFSVLANIETSMFAEAGG
jgi:hypothetical protein